VDVGVAEGAAKLARMAANRELSTKMEEHPRTQKTKRKSTFLVEEWVETKETGSTVHEV